MRFIAKPEGIKSLRESLGHEFTDREEEFFRHLLKFVQKGLLAILQGVQASIEQVQLHIQIFGLGRLAIFFLEDGSKQ